MNRLISEKRIEAIHELLLASGWKGDREEGYLARSSHREAIALEYGKGRLHLWDAINVQIRIDCYVASAVPADAA